MAWNKKTTILGMTVDVDSGAPFRSDGPRVCFTPAMIRDIGPEGVAQIAEWFAAYGSELGAIHGANIESLESLSEYELRLIANGIFSDDELKREAYTVLNDRASGRGAYATPAEISPLQRRRKQFQGRRNGLMKQVIDRDGARCRHCGSTVDLSLDHIIPLASNGGDNLSNLQILCRPCNSRKGPR